MTSSQATSILIIEAQESDNSVLKGVLLREGHTNVFHAHDSRQAFRIFRECRPDLVLLNWHVPLLEGCEILNQMRDCALGDHVPFLIFPAAPAPESKPQEEASETDTAEEAEPVGSELPPVAIADVVSRVKNFLRIKQLQSQMQQGCEEKTAPPSSDSKLHSEHFQALTQLAQTAESNDSDIPEHTQRVATLAVEIALEMGLPEAEVALLRDAALLHDIGKILVSDYILLKPGQLTPYEFEIIKTHAEVGASLLQGGQCEVVKMAHTIALTHHERWDGTGYPRGLKGDQIPLVGRIVALADVFDALCHERPYKKAWARRKAVDEIRAQSKRHFDPAVVKAFLRLEAKHSLDSEFPSLKSVSSENAPTPKQEFDEEESSLMLTAGQNNLTANLLHP